jgi:hypothetical protein
MSRIKSRKDGSETHPTLLNGGIMNNFDFPAIGISRGSILSFRNVEELSKCSRKALQGGYYQDLFLTNVKGETAVISSVHPKRKIGFLSRIFSGRMEVDLQFIKGKLLTIEDTKSKILSTIKEDQEFWESGGSLEELVAVVKGAQEWKDLVDLFY